MKNIKIENLEKILLVLVKIITFAGFLYMLLGIAASVGLMVFELFTGTLSREIRESSEGFNSAVIYASMTGFSFFLAVIAGFLYEIFKNAKIRFPVEPQKKVLELEVYDVKNILKYLLVKLLILFLMILIFKLLLSAFISAGIIIFELLVFSISRELGLNPYLVIAGFLVLFFSQSFTAGICIFGLKKIQQSAILGT
ncbi:MAG: hypothetical protein OEZ34_04120 [Spirochaetia bacterium]|nr:hypothetical protein [Spirochaetia bacterium]